MTVRDGDPFNRFSSLVSAAAASQPLMPVTHITDGWGLANIVDVGRLTAAKPCDVFSEHLLYFFYGRPAYRLDNAGGATSLHCFSLTCFVLRSETMPPPKRVFPFDSGAMNRGLYHKHFHPEMSLRDFQLAPNLRDAPKTVELFYGTNNDYFTGRSKKGLAFPVLEMAAQCYYSLISENAVATVDDRRGTIEFSYECDIPLSRDNVLAVVLPEDFWDDHAVARFVKSDLEAEPLSYECYHARPLEDVRSIMHSLKEFFQKHRILG